MFNSFNVYDEYKPKTNKQKNVESQNIIYLRIGMVMAGILIFALLIYGLTKINANNPYAKLKEKSSENFVYPAYSDDTQKIPYVNIRGFEKLNKEIENLTAKYKGKSNATISYKYNINGIVLSLIISIMHDTDEVPKLIFKSYNINLDTEGVIIDNQLLKYYGIDTNTVDKKVQAKFQEHYIKEVKKGYIVKEECNFDCYLSLRGNYKAYSYYVENGNLYAYVPFDAYSIYAEEEYFKDKDFKIYLKEAPEE